jgi:aconitate hydratase
MSIFDAAQIYAKRKTPLVVFAGYEYGTGSSRDWAAKGTALLGVKAVIAKSFERIHRSNLIGMGVLPIQLPESVSVKSLGLTGNETINILGVKNNLTPLCKLSLVIKKPNTEPITCEAICRIDTPIEVEYYKNGGILPYVLRKILST